MTSPKGGVVTSRMAEHVCQQCGARFSKRGTRNYMFCTRACSDEWRRRGKPSNDWLRTKYLDEQLTANDIALIVHRDPKRVWEWLRQAGIPTRPRGSYNTYQLSGKPSPLIGRKHTVESIANMTAGRRRVPRGAYAGNGHYLRNRRGAAHPNWQGGHTPARQSFYASSEWKLAARAVWARDRGICRRCGAQSVRTTNPRERWHVHHVIAFAVAESRADPDNLVLLCPRCHRWVHGKSNKDREFLG